MIMQNSVKPVLVLGLGNPLMQDDGVGLEIIRRLRERPDFPSDLADIEDGGTLGPDLLPLLKGRSRVIVADAVKSEKPAGALCCFRPGRSSPFRQRLSLHESGLEEALSLLALMGEKPEVEVVGVSVGDSLQFGAPLSQEASAAVEQAASAVQEAACR